MKTKPEAKESAFTKNIPKKRVLKYYRAQRTFDNLTNKKIRRVIAVSSAKATAKKKDR
jgi:hypothetical protein